MGPRLARTRTGGSKHGSSHSRKIMAPVLCEASGIAEDVESKRRLLAVMMLAHENEAHAAQGTRSADMPSSTTAASTPRNTSCRCAASLEAAGRPASRAEGMFVSGEFAANTGQTVQRWLSHYAYHAVSMTAATLLHRLFAKMQLTACCYGRRAEQNVLPKVCLLLLGSR